MSIIFLGSGPFALPIVKSIAERFAVDGLIVTKPKPKGRGRRVILPDTAQWAQINGIKVFTPEDPNEGYFIEKMREAKPELFVLTSYGHILRNELLDVPKYGGINIHPSLLPQYRGAAPIRRVLMEGKEETGISVIFMDEKIDHGDIIFTKNVSVSKEDTYGSLLTKLASIAAEHISSVVESVFQGSYSRIKQDHNLKSYARKIKKEDMVINWHKGTDEAYNLVRALSPTPGAQTHFRGNEIKIIDASPSDEIVEPGLISVRGKQMYVGTGDGSLFIKRVKPAGKKVMSGLDFINGFQPKKDEVMR